MPQRLEGSLGVPPSQQPHPTTARYTHLLASASAQSYPVLLAALWAIELCYNQAWTHHQPTQPTQEPAAQCAERWGSQEFSAWVERLEAAADAALAEASPAERCACPC